MGLLNNEITFFATNEYESITTKHYYRNDVDETEQYTIKFYLSKGGGVLLKVRFVEISGVSETNSLLLRHYRGYDDFEDTEIKLIGINCGVAATEKIKSVAISAGDVPAEHRLGVLASGGINPFDVEIKGKYWS